MSKDSFPADNDILELTEVVDGNESEAGSEVEKLLRELDPVPGLDEMNPTGRNDKPERLVDPHEKLAMPELGDIDVLLAELGVPVEDGPRREPVRQEEVRPPLDDLPAELASLVDNAPPSAGPHDAEQNFLSKNRASQTREEGIDLNELDTLLNDMLSPQGGESTARSSDARVTVTPDSLVAESREVLTQVESTPLVAGEPMAEALALRVSTLEEELRGKLAALEEGATALADRLALRQKEMAEAMDGKIGELATVKDSLEQRLAASHTQLSAAVDARITTLEADNKQLAAKLAAAEEQLGKFKAQFASLPETLTQIVDARLQAALAPESDAITRMAAKSTELVLEALEGSSDQVGTDMMQRLHESLEKSAASAAAKVIREEIGALLKG